MKLPYQQIITIESPDPYDFTLTLQEFRQYPLDVTERVIGGALLRGFRLPDDTPVLTVIRQDDSDRLSADVYARQQVEESEVVPHIRHTLNLDLDLKHWYEAIDADDPMHPIIEGLYGLRPGAKPTVFESLVTAILEQQLNVRFACTLETRLIEKYGTKLTCDQGVVWLFPTPEALASLGIDELRELQLSRAKADYVIGLAKQITDGEIDPEAWHELDDASLMDRLTEIRGVGQWTAEYVAMIGYRRFNHAPAADIGLRNAVTKLTAADEQLPEETTRAFMHRWDEYKGLATVYIWHAYAAGMIK